MEHRLVGIQNKSTEQQTNVMQLWCDGLFRHGLALQRYRPSSYPINRLESRAHKIGRKCCFFTFHLSGPVSNLTIDDSGSYVRQGHRKRIRCSAAHLCPAQPMRMTEEEPNAKKTNPKAEQPQHARLPEMQRDAETGNHRPYVLGKPVTQAQRRNNRDTMLSSAEEAFTLTSITTLQASTPKFEGISLRQRSTSSRGSSRMPLESSNGPWRKMNNPRTITSTDQSLMNPPTLTNLSTPRSLNYPPSMSRLSTATKTYSQTSKASRASKSTRRRLTSTNRSLNAGKGRS